MGRSLPEHRHSEDGGIIDGSLLDTMRYSLDAAGLDFIGITDHTRYLPRRFNLFGMQQVTDAVYRPGWFAPLHAYERSSRPGATATWRTWNGITRRRPLPTISAIKA